MGYLVLGVCVPGPRGVPGPGGGFLVLGVGTWSWGVYLVRGVPGTKGGVNLVPGDVPDPGGVPGQVLPP